jgi:hypothetical protein
MTYEALDAALYEGPAAAIASLICIQFAFSLFSGSSAANGETAAAGPLFKTASRALSRVLFRALSGAAF